MYLVSCSSSGDLKLWDTKYGDARYVLTYETAHDLGVLGCDFSSQYEVNGECGENAQAKTHVGCLSQWQMAHCKVSTYWQAVETMT